MAYRHLIYYRFEEQSREFQVDLDQRELSADIAVLHLLQLHFGDAENGLILPRVDASADDILEQGRLLGISFTRSRLVDEV